MPLEPGWWLAEVVGLQFLSSALASRPHAAGAAIWAPGLRNGGSASMVRPAGGTVRAALAASLRDPAEFCWFRNEVAAQGAGCCCHRCRIPEVSAGCPRPPAVL